MTNRQDQESEHGAYERRKEDPAGRPTPFVEGPTGAAPLASELRGDPGAEGDRQGEGGAMAGALVGTAAAGPVGGVVGAIVGGTAGTASEAAADTDDSESFTPEADDRAIEQDADRSSSGSVTTLPD